MPAEAKVVAILTANPALSAIVHMVLSSNRDLRVRLFENAAELSLYMHIAPVDLLVCDYEMGDAESVALVPRLRAKDGLVRPDFQVIALTRSISSSMKAACVEAGIDEVIVKPMSPRHLEQRVAARLGDGPRHIAAGGYRGPERRGRLADPPPVRASNVVPLFGNTPDRRAPVHDPA